MATIREIIFATTNPAKAKQLAGALAPVGIMVRGVSDKDILSAVAEDGDTAPENARKKAVAYAQALNQTVLSMDNALYFDDLPAKEQPGIRVRRINAATERPTDEEMLEYYSQLIRRFGETTAGHWEFAICVANPDGSFRETVIVSARIFTSKVSAKMIAGYPLESIQLDPETGKYIAEMDQAEQDRFWQKAIGQPLQDFIRTIEA